MRRLAVAAIGLLSSAAASADPAELRLGAFVLPYDDRDWRLLDLGNDLRESARRDESSIGYTLMCVSPLCRERGTVSIAVTPAGSTEECPAGFLIESGGDGRLLPSPLLADSPLQLIRWRDFGPCRAYTPAGERACGVHDGLVYDFASGGNFGCSGIEGVGPEAFDALIAGLRPVGAHDDVPTGGHAP